MQKTRKPKTPTLKLNALKVPDTYDLQAVGVTQTLINAFQCCRVRWLMMLHGYRNILKNRVTVFGTIMHGLLERLYKFGIPTEAIRLKWIEQIKKEEPDSFRAVDAEQINTDVWMAESLFLGYCAYWKSDFKTLKSAQTEHEFGVEFNGVKIRGKMDVREEDKSGDIWLWEHKFLGRIEEDVLSARLAMDLQSQLYLLADFHERGEWAKGIKYNIVRKPQLKPKAKIERGIDPEDPKGKKKIYSPETRIEYLQRVRADIMERPDFYFIRHRVTWTAKDREAFLAELSHKLNEMSRVIEGDLMIWRNQAACIMPYKCDYLDACETGSLANYKGGPLFPELKEGKAAGRKVKAPKKTKKTAKK